MWHTIIFSEILLLNHKTQFLDHESLVAGTETISLLRDLFLTMELSNSLSGQWDHIYWPWVPFYWLGDHTSWPGNPICFQWDHISWPWDHVPWAKNSNFKVYILAIRNYLLARNLISWPQKPISLPRDHISWP